MNAGTLTTAIGVARTIRRLQAQVTALQQALSASIAGSPVQIKRGTGSPEGVISGAIGDIYIDISNPTSHQWYTKTTEGGNTGWL